VGRRGRLEHQVSERLIEQVVECAAPARNFPVLTKMNYYD
jgi:hypothetical protein